MYRYRYINKHIQFNYINYTLVLEDLECNPPKIVRIDKSFNVDSSTIDNDFLYQEARKEIIRVTIEDSLESPIAEKDIIEETSPEVEEN